MSEKILSAIDRLSATSAKVAEHNQAHFDELQGRLELLEGAADRPRANIDLSSNESREQKQYRGAFVEWLRRPQDDVAKSRLTQAIGDLQTKDVSIGLSNWDRTEILDGVKEGAKIISSINLADLKEHARVVVQ